MINKIFLKKIFVELDKIVPTLQVPVAELIKSRGADPFRILIITILSARTKDSLLVKKIPDIFENIGDLESLESISLKRLEKILYPIGFYKTKARHLKQLVTILKQDFDGRIPDTIEDLITLPGVGRKTANLVLNTAFGKPAICVDVHVHRISNRLGLVKTNSPFETEMKLRESLPKIYWNKINHYFVAYGQSICKPLNPSCSSCSLKKYCTYASIRKK